MYSAARLMRNAPHPGGERCDELLDAARCIALTDNRAASATAAQLPGQLQCSAARFRILRRGRSDGGGAFGPESQYLRPRIRLAGMLLQRGVAGEVLKPHHDCTRAGPVPNTRHHSVAECLIGPTHSSKSIGPGAQRRRGQLSAEPAGEPATERAKQASSRVVGRVIRLWRRNSHRWTARSTHPRQGVHWWWFFLGI